MSLIPIQYGKANPKPDASLLQCTLRSARSYRLFSLPQSSSASRFNTGAAHGLLPKAGLLCQVCLLAAVNFQVAIQPRLDSESILLLTSTTCAVVATRADTCRTSNSIMSSLSAIFIAPVTSTSCFMVLLLLHYGMLVAYIWTSNPSRLYVWSC